MFTSYSAFSNAILTDLPMDDKEPVNGKIAPTTKSFFPYLWVDDERINYLLLIKYLFSLLLKTFVEYKPIIIDNVINVREPSKTFLEIRFLVLVIIL